MFDIFKSLLKGNYHIESGQQLAFVFILTVKILQFSVWFEKSYISFFYVKKLKLNDVMFVDL